MAVLGSGDTGRIFISYRRDDTDWPATWLFERLAEYFGADQVFKDVDSIRPGDDFVEVITDAVGSCHVLLAVMGTRWLAITNEDGRRRLDDPADFVRLEIEAALTREVRVVPILVEGARMPRSDQLPEALGKLAQRQAIELVPSRFKADCARLLSFLDDVLADVPAVTAEPDPFETPKPGQANESKERLAAGTVGPAPVRLPSRVMSTLAGHGSGFGKVFVDHGVLDVAFRSDGRLLASAGADGTVRLWEVAAGRETLKLPSRGDAVRCVAFSPDGKLLAFGGVNGIRLLSWDPAEVTMTHDLAGPGPQFRSLAFSPDGALLASGGDYAVRLWDVAARKQVCMTAGHDGRLYAVAFSPDGDLVASGGADNTVRLYEVASGTEIRKLSGHGARVRALAFSPDGALLASAGDDAMVVVWKLAMWQRLHVLTDHTSGVRGVAFSPDGSVLASASRDHTVRLWDVATGQEVGQLAGHNGWVHCVAFSPDGALLASGSGDQMIRLWGT